MANQSFRDVNTTVFGATAVQGVQTIRVTDEGEVITFVADANAYEQDVGLTKQIAMMEVERISSEKLRDVLSAVFTAAGGASTGTAILGRVQEVTIRQGGKVIRDSGDADAWIRYLGLTDINGEVTVGFRDLAQLHAAPLVKGRKGTLRVKVPIPRTGFGLPAGTASETHAIICELVSMEKGGAHGEIGEARATFRMYGATNPWTPSGLTGGKQLRPIALGWKGTASWSAPPADAGASEACSVANALLVGIDVTLRHGEYSRATYRFEAHSSDGAASPIT